MNARNKEIRELMRKNKVTAFAVGEVLGVHENSVFRYLRKELSEQDKQKYISIINDLAARDQAAVSD